MLPDAVCVPNSCYFIIGKLVLYTTQVEIVYSTIFSALLCGFISQSMASVKLLLTSKG